MARGEREGRGVEAPTLSHLGAGGPKSHAVELRARLEVWAAHTGGPKGRAVLLQAVGARDVSLHEQGGSSHAERVRHGHGMEPAL